MGQILAASALMGAAAYGVWRGLDEALGSGLGAQIASVGTACLAATMLYAGAVLLMRVREAEQVRALIAGRRPRRPA